MPTEAEQIRRAIDDLADRIVSIEAAIPDPEQTRMAMREAVSEGVRDVLTDRDALASGMDMLLDVSAQAMQRRANERAGRFLMDMLKGALVRGATFMVLGVIVYNLGGWTSLVATWKALKGAP